MPDRQVEEAGEARLEVLAAEAVEAPGAPIPLAEDPGFPQGVEVCALSRLADRPSKGVAGQLSRRRLGKPDDDRHPHRVAERRHHPLEAELLTGRVHELGGGSACHTSRISTCSDMPNMCYVRGTRT